MSKITRRSFKRKKIIMGATLFGSVGMVSTGFAAWVLSSSSQASTQSGLKVGVVDNNNLTITDLKVYRTDPRTEIVSPNIAEYQFEPRAADNSGRLHYDGENEEILSYTVEGTIEYAYNLGKLEVIFGGSTAEAQSKIETAVSYNLITAPFMTSTIVYDSMATTPINNANVQAIANDPKQSSKFSIEVAFGWGSEFNNINPGDYFDGDGYSVPQGEDEDALFVPDNSSTRTVYGLLNQLHNLLDSLSVTFTITASPK